MKNVMSIVAVAAIFGTSASALAGSVIAQQNFDNSAWLGGQYTDTGDASVDHDLVNNPGEAFVDGGGGVDGIAFDAYYRNTRDDVGLTDGDFVGVTNFTGDVGSFTSGDQGYQFSDADGVMGLSFAAVNITGAVSPSLSLDYFIKESGYESDDAVRIWAVVDGGTELDLLNTIGSDIDDLGIEDAWTTLSLDLTGFTTVALNIEFESNAGTEAMYIDTVVVSDQVPAPGALALLGIAGLASRRRRRA